ncbi:MAG: type II toxin-antitoxin system VapC family toxin [Candidatus Wallbacteria bacterium]|nr:type II toxin-antitoxin system VapC family toxin [Candidatus Wallbacteria bacterium]
MNFFIDTSALVKLFHTEEGSEKVVEIVESPDNEIWISELTRAEFFSAIFRRYRNGEIKAEALTSIIDGFEKQISGFNVEPLSSSVVREAEQIIRKYGKKEGIRTLDALQAGSFTLISDSKNWVFIAADARLCNTVKSMGFATKTV